MEVSLSRQIENKWLRLSSVFPLRFWLVGVQSCTQKIGDFSIANNEKSETESRAPNKNADSMIKIGCIVTQPIMGPTKLVRKKSNTLCFAIFATIDFT